MGGPTPPLRGSHTSTRGYVRPGHQSGRSGTRKMNVGVIGGGYWGSKHVRVLTGLLGADHVCLVDPYEPALERARAVNPQLRTFTSVDDGLPHLDAAVIATRPSSHANLARQALDAGKHVLVEKPLAT